MSTEHLTTRTRLIRSGTREGVRPPWENGEMSRVGLDTSLDPTVAEYGLGHISAAVGLAGSAHFEIPCHAADKAAATASSSAWQKPYVVHADPISYSSAISDSSNLPFPRSSASPDSPLQGSASDNTNSSPATSMSSSELFRCRIPPCHDTFPHRKSRRRHEQEQHEPKTFDWMCSFCGHGFGRRSNCTKHIGKYHTNVSEEVRAVAIPRPIMSLE